MNISHRSIWNPALGAWVAVSEITRARGKRTLRGIAALQTQPNGRRSSLNTALILAGLLAASGSVIAQTSHWLIPGPGDWNVGGNWSGGSTPTGARDVILDRGGATATLSAAGTAKTLYVYNSDEVIVTTGGALVVSDLISLGTVAGAGTARLTIQAGGTVSAARLYAGDAARQGIVTVTGTGSRLTVAPVPGESFTIGSGGAGELHIDADANVTVNGTRTLHLGRVGNGTLFIGSGAGAGTLTADAVVFRTAGSSVQFNHTGATTFAAAISGDGFLTKTGTGTTTLTGANSYTGGTTVSAGTLQGNSSSLQGNITNNAAVTFDQAVAGTYAGAMGGTGSLNKAGTGTLTLTGANTFTGRTTVNAGTLAIGDMAALGTGDVWLNNGAELLATVDGTDDFRSLTTSHGRISAAAGKTFTINYYNLGSNLSFGSSSNTGTVVFATAGVAGLAVGATANVDFGTLRLGDSFVASGLVGGGGRLNVAAGATVELDGRTVLASHLGGSGTVTTQGSAAASLKVGDGATADSSFAGTLSDGADPLAKVSLVKEGSRTLTLSGSNTYTGGTTVSGGTLLVNGSTANSAVSVASGATLGGSGTVGATTVAAGGALQGSAGQGLTTGTLALDNTSQVNVSLGAPSTAKLFQVNGNLTLDGQLKVSDLGGFGVGVYRIFDYTGSLTNNGLDVRSAPPGATLGALSVQTAVANQVNLINTSGQTLQFWDGDAAGHANNGAINGGAGTWTATSGNWTEADGTVSAPMTPTPGFAIFQGPAGTVTASNSAGALTVTGMQFASDGYVLQGDAITLSGAKAIVRVGDGAGGTPMATIHAALTGSAALEKTDTGTLILTGANSYSGGTTVSGGVLQGNTTSLQGAISNNAAVIFDQAATGTYAGAMSGTGALTKTGAGTLTLTGTNTYTGGTTINSGTLALGAGGSLAATGAVNLNGAGAGFDISAATTNQAIGSLSGVAGSTVTLGGINLTTGADNRTSTYAGAISGTGNLAKVGSGTMTLTGTSNYGATTVIGGTLAVNGSMTSTVTVHSGGTLGGRGTVGNTTIAAGGILAPGNSIGTLTVAGNLSFAPGSIYRVEVDALGANDRTNVTGTADLNGTVAVLAAAGSYDANTTYTVLNAAGGRTGNFTGVTSDLAFLTPSLGYDANNVFLSLARNEVSFSAPTIAVTPNQIAISTALQNANAAATGDMSTVQTALTGLSAAQARAAYDAASGAGLIALRGAGTGFAAGLGSQLQARLGAVQSGGAGGLANALAHRPILLAANSHGSDLSGLLNTTMSDAPVQQFSLASGTALPSAATTQGRGFWLRGSGGYQDTKTDGNAAASQQRNTALSAGFDTQLQDGLVVGAALSSGTSRLSFDNSDSGKSRGSALALYGSYDSGSWAFKASASAGWNDNHMDRTVTVGALSRTASSDFNSHTLSAYGEAQYSIPMNGWTLQPVAGLSISRDKADGFTETGAGALNLQVEGQTNDSAKSLLGVKASFEAGSVRLEPRAIWAHEFGDLKTPMTAQFQGAASASPFQVAGVALKRDTLILGLGASGSIGQGMDLFADVQLEHNSRQRNAGVMVGLRASW